MENDTCYRPRHERDSALASPHPSRKAEPAFSNPSPHSNEQETVSKRPLHVPIFMSILCAWLTCQVVNDRVFGLHTLACSSCHRHSCLAPQDPFVALPRFDWLPNTQLSVFYHQAARAQIFWCLFGLVEKTPCTIVHAVPPIQSHLFLYLSLPILSLASRLRKLGVFAKSFAVSYWPVSIPPLSHL